MPEWAKVLIGSLVLLIGASALPLILETVHPGLSRRPSQSEMRSPSGGNRATERHAQVQAEEAYAASGTTSINNLARPQLNGDVGSKPEKGSHWYEKPDWWTAIFTALLFLATSVLSQKFV